MFTMDRRPFLYFGGTLNKIKGGFNFVVCQLNCLLISVKGVHKAALFLLSARLERKVRS